MRVAILLSLVSVAAGLAAAQSDLSAALDQIASSELTRQKIPGFSAAVASSAVTFPLHCSAAAV